MSRSKQHKQGTCHTRAHSLSEINKGKKRIWTLSLIIDAVFMYLCDDLASALIDILMCYYYVFNTEYPKSMYSLYIFLQHFVLGLKDNSKLPTAVISLCSSL